MNSYSFHSHGAELTGTHCHKLEFITTCSSCASCPSFLYLVTYVTVGTNWPSTSCSTPLPQKKRTSLTLEMKLVILSHTEVYESSSSLAYVFNLIESTMCNIIVKNATRIHSAIMHYLCLPR